MINENVKKLIGIVCIVITIIIIFTGGIIKKTIDKKMIDKYADVNRVIQKKDLSKHNHMKGDNVAVLTIPKLGIYNETITYGLDGAELHDSASTLGYLGGWGLFGEKQPSEVGAHNYELFKKLPSIEIGDIVIVKNEIDTYTYEVTEAMVFNNDKDDWDKDVYSKSEPYSLTLITCYPIYKKETEDRYVVFTKLIGGTIDIEN